LLDQISHVEMVGLCNEISGMLSDSGVHVHLLLVRGQACLEQRPVMYIFVAAAGLHGFWSQKMKHARVEILVQGSTMEDRPRHLSTQV